MEQYEILEQIGRGSFASALLVRHRHENKKYVLKKIRLARQTDRTRRSAHQEMELISKVRNPFIVDYKDSWVEKGCFVCIVIGYCEGGDMTEAIKKANGVHFPEEKLSKWLVQLLMALDYLHANHILHRDVKCSNIFLTKDQDIRLGDFGLAKMLTCDDLASSVVGTPSYMCPELLADIPYGSKSDIWSLGCCVYEMAAHKPAFKALVSFSLWVAIFSLDDTLSAKLSIRGLIKSMLRKNPELRPSEMVFNDIISVWTLKTFGTPKLESSSTTDHSPLRVHFLAPDSVSTLSGRDKRLSFSNDRALNPSISGTEVGSVCSTQRGQGFSTCSKEKHYELSVGCVREECNSNKSRDTKSSTVDRMPRLRTAKEYATPRRQTIPSKISNTGSKRELLPAYSTPGVKFTVPTRRASLPLPTRTMGMTTPYRANVGLLRDVDSPDISVNAPRIDKIAEFPLASCEDSLFPVHGTSSTLAQCSSGSPKSADCLITKDKCTIQVVDKVSVPSSVQSPKSAAPVSHGNECSEHAVSSHSSAESRQQRFDPSSYQQRAEALEGLLEFSARLLQQQRFEELGVLLKPFGPEKVSPRETAIWLAKSFKETVA
ncbi:unnamed protein product [Sphenostylis stenocarpa]|uniref:non-specific serine/threonine protein kinase n=1 Tax=Sphenostylis stenocarpa TaxID=92480 RepID=A0AA86SPU0_9FABA|nr:unnamed protein product [Sphenostylis stenocarpa]